MHTWEMTHIVKTDSLSKHN